MQQDATTHYQGGLALRDFVGAVPILAPSVQLQGKGATMSIAPTVHQALKMKEIDHEILRHPHAASSSRVAEAAHVTGDCIAKAVVLKDEQGFVLAVLPATHRILTEVL